MKPSHCKIGDTYLVKQRGKVTRWEVLEVEEATCKAKNTVSGKIKPFGLYEQHIVIPPDGEIPASLRNKLPKNIGICRVIGASQGERCSEAYQMFSRETLDVIVIEQQTTSVISFDFTIMDGEAQWHMAGQEDTKSAQTFTGQTTIKLSRALARDIQQEVNGQF